MLENGMTKPHWIRFDDSDTYSCSECGVIWELDDGTPKDNLTDDFKRKVVDMVVEMAERKEE